MFQTDFQLDEPRITIPETGRCSPRLELQPGNAVKSFIESGDKIHRMVPQYRFIAKCVYVVSPSSIWMQLPNHITSQLQLNSTNGLDPAEVALFKYVMAPISSDQLGRARILKLEDSLAYVYFIDAGIPSIVNTSNLFKIPNNLIYHPWQTIPIKLFGVNPLNKESWSMNEVNLLKHVLNQFPYFWIQPEFSSDSADDDAFYESAHVVGLTESEYNVLFSKGIKQKTLGECIAISFYLEANFLKNQCSVDGADQKGYPYFDKSFYLSFHKKIFHRESMLSFDVSRPFYFDNPFPQLSQHPKNIFHKKRKNFWVFTMEPNSTSTPNRFFAYRLDSKDGTIPNDPNRFRRFSQESQQLAADMSEFYFQPKHHYILDFNKVYNYLLTGQRVFGVVEFYQKTFFFSTKYQRVEVLHCVSRDSGRHKLYRVRLIDTGGIQLFTHSSVYHIHSNHLSIYPLSCLLYFTCISKQNKTDREWCNNDLRPFNEQYLRPNKVFLVKLEDQPGISIDLSKPLHVKSLGYAVKSDKKSVEDFMVENNYAIKSADSLTDLYADIRFENEIQETERNMMNPSSINFDDADSS